MLRCHQKSQIDNAVKISGSWCTTMDTLWKGRAACDVVAILAACSQKVKLFSALVPPLSNPPTAASQRSMQVENIVKRSSPARFAAQHPPDARVQVIRSGPMHPGDIELMQMIRKNQLPSGAKPPLSTAAQFYSLTV
jgi:hypothetical protein